VRVSETLSRVYILGAIYQGGWTVWAPRWASINRGGPYSMTASVNTLTEAVVLGQPPRLIDINRGGHLRVPASVNLFYEAVVVTAPVNKK
jgi:hypothetical protein